MAHPTLRAKPWPLEWVLLRPPLTPDSNQCVPMEGVCCVSGRTVTKDSGARCARCARPVALTLAGLRGLDEDVPSCPDCRAEVSRFYEGGVSGEIVVEAPP